MILQGLAAFIARNGRLVLVLGLIAGVLLPGLAEAMRPWIVPMIAGLLFLSALRVGPRQIATAFSQIANAAKLALLFQIALPLAAVVLFRSFGPVTAFGSFIVLMLAAAPISGSPNITAMTGNDPAVALRQLIVGTALLPLTVLPVFWFIPAFGAPEAVVWAALKLLGIIGTAAALAFVLRETVLKQPSMQAYEAIDTISAVALGVVVIGLMSAVGPALKSDPLNLLGVLLGVCAINFAIQIAIGLIARRMGRPELAAPLGIAGGNRNIALFLTVIPAASVEPLLLLIGCYQVPMYLTPMVLGRFYGKQNI